MTSGVGRTTSNYMFSSWSSSDEERLPERAHGVKEKIHFQYQSRRAHHQKHLYHFPIPYITNYHGGAAHNSLSYSRNFYPNSTYVTGHVPLGSNINPQHLHYQSRRAHQKTHFGHPYTWTAPASKKYISTTNHDGRTNTHVQPWTILGLPLIYLSSQHSIRLGVWRAWWHPDKIP